MSQRDQNLQPELAPRQQTGSRATVPLRTTIKLIRHQHRAALLDTPHGTTVQQAAVLDGEPLRQHNLHSLRAVQLLLRGHSPTSRRPLLPARFRGLPLFFRPQRIGRRSTARSPLLRHTARSNAPAPTPADERPHSRPAAAPARNPRPVSSHPHFYKIPRTHAPRVFAEWTATCAFRQRSTEGEATFT